MTMQEGGQEILVEMEKLASVTLEINSGIKEISSGVMDINNAMQEVNERSKENYESISKVSSELGKFKVNHQE